MEAPKINFPQWVNGARVNTNVTSAQRIFKGFDEVMRGDIPTIFSDPYIITSNPHLCRGSTGRCGTRFALQAHEHSWLNGKLCVGAPSLIIDITCRNCCCGNHLIEAITSLSRCIMLAKLSHRRLGEFGAPFIYHHVPER
eukprot:GHVN01104199.1.p2 GENE.GHVN01104199.1~~GHVN01104199.1.p2  ORF type:complete len:140 (-),score=6.74 GHVN01104199.1:2393-2812(-)